MTKPTHTHSTVIKATQVLELKTLYIEPNEDGSMSIESLRGRLTELKHKKHLNLIVNINFGTTYGAAFDDVVEIRKVLNEIKNEDWNYAVHMDASFYGPTLPFLK
jgi:glutamate/tyrosine decarboxylase-like PLP-dependent enzyme